MPWEHRGGRSSDDIEAAGERGDVADVFGGGTPPGKGKSFSKSNRKDGQYIHV